MNAENKIRAELVLLQDKISSASEELSLAAQAYEEQRRLSQIKLTNAASELATLISFIKKYENKKEN